MNENLFSPKPNINLIFHSDRGSQYNSYAFKDLLSKYKIIQSS